MHKISSLTGSARHGWDKMTPSMSFGSQRTQHDQPGMPVMNSKTRQDTTNIPRQGVAPRHNPLSLSFNVPFSSNLAGPEAGDVIHSSPGAFARWTHAERTPDGTQNHKLPIHVGNVEALRAMCRHITDNSEGKIQATVTSSEPRPIPGLQLGPLNALVTNVCLYGEQDLVRRIRGRILNDSPICLKCATVDIDQDLIGDPQTGLIRAAVLEHMNYIASYTGTDIFLLKPKQIDIETASFNGTLDNTLDQRCRIAVFGDMESADHAKTRVLIMIDQILKRKVDVYKLELSLHTIVCGRLRRHIKQIESMTNTAIYFPPPFPQLYGYTPPGANRRREDEIFITGETEHDIYQAKLKLHELVRTTTTCSKEVRISADKVDSILLERLDKIRRIIEYNGSYVMFPQLGVQRGSLRVQGTDMLHVERTIREIMALSGQFYGAQWWITLSDSTQRAPTSNDIKSMLADICISSGAEIGFERLTFHIYGSDDAVKAALWIINTLPFVKKAQSQLKVKIELASEHKEFVSGKKNGKINKIMSQSNVQVYFDLFNEYNFFIDVSGPNYDATKNGLDLVEQEMPASIAFHVPDQYHKRIIGIGGQHIQRIMKKYSVFVKFSNAMDRGGSSKEDDDIKVDNVICRTPARNAQSLDLVKQEIMDMVEESDAEFVSEHVIVNRLYHRELLHRMAEIEDLEKRCNCKVTFPSTEQASDVVTVTGPQYKVPEAVDKFLGMVPESHEITLFTNEELSEYFITKTFQEEVVNKMRTQYEIDVHVNGLSSAAAADAAAEASMESLTLSYTRNNAGGLKDAIDFLTSQLVQHGLDGSTVRGAIPRPKSDSFEDSLPFFDSKLLHPSEPVAPTESPNRSVDGHERSFFDKFKKPGSISSLSSFLNGSRKNGSTSSGSFMKYASSNASKASLVSLESQGSGYRNPWNDSGVGLQDDDNGWPARFTPIENKGPFSAALGSNNGSAKSNAISLGNTLPPPSSSHLNVVPALSAGDATPTNDRSYSGRLSPAKSTSVVGTPEPLAPPS